MRISAVRQSFLLALVLIPGSICALLTTPSPAQTVAPPLKMGILSRDQASSVLPAKVFYRGQSAPIQARNSGGVRYADSKVVLAALVDTSGYSSTVQETYQAYLITEVTLKLGDKELAPGAYGFGFIADNKMVVMDIGANQLLSTTTTHDAKLARPNPLQVLPDPASASRYRLYLGRNYVTFEVSSKK